MIKTHLNKAKVLKEIVEILDKYKYSYNIIFMEGTQSKYQINVTANEDYFKIDVFIKVNGEKSISMGNTGENYKFLLQELDFLKTIPKNLDKTIKLDREIVENKIKLLQKKEIICCLLYTSPSPRDRQKSRMPSSA